MAECDDCFDGEHMRSWAGASNLVCREVGCQGWLSRTGILSEPKAGVVQSEEEEGLGYWCSRQKGQCVQRPKREEVLHAKEFNGIQPGWSPEHWEEVARDRETDSGQSWVASKPYLGVWSVSPEGSY